MRQPFWIVNSLLLLEFLAVTYYTWFMPIHLPSIKAIRPQGQELPAATEPVSGDFSAIYTNDLFGTEALIYRGNTAAELETSNFPLPPDLAEPEAPLPVQPQFLAPLNITLTGIMTFGNHLENIAIILDNTTKTEINYRIGDQLQDAQVIDITQHKVELIRANGQQETLYLYQREAQAELARTTPNWQRCVQQLDGHHFQIDVGEFKTRLTNLGQLIDQLGLTTAYQNGTTLGCRVGQAGYQSLGAALGLQPGDIITAIAELPTLSTADRYRIYHQLVALAEQLTNATLKPADTPLQAVGKTPPVEFTVQLLRQGQELLLTYRLTTDEDVGLAPLAQRLRPATAPSETEFILPERSTELRRQDFQLPASPELSADKYAATVQKQQYRTQQQLLQPQRPGVAHVA